ncbi:hypothetical protein LTR28_008292 [Elasticomyces elasticus]|nr:hypothetical protein LTR28_008292 [Elasticomyces elasticus]
MDTEEITYQAQDALASTIKATMITTAAGAFVSTIQNTLTKQNVGAMAPAVLGYGAFTAVILGVFTYTGGRLSGYVRDPEVDEVSRKEYLRKNRRRPIDEVVNQLGEGRGTHMCLMFNSAGILTTAGIYGPGYEERRAERIKERYGIDVPPRVPAA